VGWWWERGEGVHWRREISVEMNSLGITAEISLRKDGLSEVTILAIRADKSYAGDQILANSTGGMYVGLIRQFQFSWPTPPSQTKNSQPSPLQSQHTL